MSYKIAIASGKGGTGKTTVSVNLFKGFNELRGKKVQLVDCDVEEPNDAIFFCDAEVVDVQAGVQHIWIGDATTAVGPAAGGEFEDNTAVGFGVKVGYTF